MRSMLAVVVLCGWASAAAAAGPPADLVVRGAVIHTAANRRPRAGAMAVRGGRIVAIGDDRAVAALIGPRTRVLDLHGLTVLPGLVDSHGHVEGLGGLLANVDVTGTRSYAAVVESVRARAARTLAGEWIGGRGWDQNDWSETSFPTHAALSAAVPDHPVVLRRVDGHAVLLNARALVLAHVTRDTPDPAGGEIVRGADGEPTGVLVDNATDLVDAVIPPLSPAQHEQRLLAAMREAARHGLTLVHDAGIDREQYEAYHALLARGDFPIRVYAMASAAGRLADSLLAHGPEIGDRFSVRALKLYADGALGSRGALLSADYSDRPGHRGLAVTPFDSIGRVAVRARAAGLQVRVHAIGDLATTGTLDAYQRAFGGAPHPELRWAIEHAQIVRPEDIRRFARLGVVAAMQATHATSDAPWAGRRLGPGRIRWSYAWRQFLDAGARFANGSDFPVESVNPMLGLYASITRRDLANELPAAGWRPEEKLTPEEALRSFSLWGAWLAFRERDLGSLEVGKLADFIVVDRDPIAGPASGIPGTRVLRTVVGGETVYEAVER
jgi:hypothetical protein